MYVGTPHSALTLQPAEFELINRKELTLKGSWMNYSAPFPGWEWKFGIEMITKQQIDIEALMGRVLPLSQAGGFHRFCLNLESRKGRLCWTVRLNLIRTASVIQSWRDNNGLN